MADQPPSVVDAEIIEARDLVLLADPEQLNLLTEEKGGDAAAAVIEHGRRGRGRPRGSLNRRNAKFRDQLLAIAPHPALALVRAYSTPVEQLAAQLGCTKHEAAQLGIRAAAELLPYVESKQPVDVNVKQRNDVVMIMPGQGITDAQIEAMRSEIAEADEIDWSTAEIGDLNELLPSLSGEPSQDVSQP